MFQSRPVVHGNFLQPRNMSFQGLEYLKQGLSFSQGQITPYWAVDITGVFSVKSGYNFFMSLKQRMETQGGEASDSTAVSCFWSTLWKLQLPSKIKIFAWKLYHNAIPCAENLVRKGCLLDLNCQSCGARVESSMHVFRDCWWARCFLGKLGFGDDILSVEFTEPGYWLWFCEKRCSKEGFRQLLCGLWFLWFRRNSAVHGAKELGMDDLYAKFIFYLSQLNRQPSLDIMGIHWPTENDDCITICCDGSWSAADGVGGWGFVVCGKESIMEVGAGWKEGIPSCHVMEGQALLEGFNLAASRQWHRVSFKIDSAVVFRAVVMGQCRDFFSHSWLLRCWNFLDKFPSWKIVVVAREEISLADGVARKAREELWRWDSNNAIPLVNSFA